jgi:hypothetical protein
MKLIMGFGIQIEIFNFFTNIIVYYRKIYIKNITIVIFVKEFKKTILLITKCDYLYTNSKTLIFY